MTDEELFEWCSKQNCKPHPNCDLCMYNKGRADAERDFQNSDYWNDYLAEVISDTKADAIEELSKEIEYCLNCGMGKVKSLEHLLKICRNS